MSEAQARNIDGAVEHVFWALSLRGRGGAPWVDPTRVALGGHSAGGAVSLEAAVALRCRGVRVAGLVLLDAVPWPRTVATAAGLFEPRTGRCPIELEREGGIVDIDDI